MGEELELGVPSLNIQLKDMGGWVPWGMEQEPVVEGPPLSPLPREEPMVVEEGTEQAQKDGSMVKDDATAE